MVADINLRREDDVQGDDGLGSWKDHLDFENIPMSRCSSTTSITSLTSMQSNGSSVSTASSSRPKKYLCEYDNCNKAFTRPSLLSEHQITFHQGIKPFKCDQCAKSYARKTHLERHIISNHSLEKPFHCQHCGKGVTTRQQLKRHEITHTKSFHCPYENCQESFYKHPQLRSHILSFHLEKLKCKYCNKNFQRPYRLANHIKKHHNPDTENPYQCSVSIDCNLTFKTWTKYQLHIKNDHPKLRCSICNKSCVGENGLKMHMNIHNESLVIKNWKCQFCPIDKFISFSKKTDLLSHYQSCHKDEQIPIELLQNKVPIMADSSTVEDITIKKEHDAVTTKEQNKNEETIAVRRITRAMRRKQNNPIESIRSEINLDKYIENNKERGSSMNLLLNTVGRKYKCTFYKCYRTFKTEDKFKKHIEKHKIHQLKLKILEEKQEEESKKLEEPIDLPVKTANTIE
ncbi:Pzf1p NDAI_0J00160 [Naumovozyma dairenensis CBS 421]|uniref:Transcription factor IIIA n=1 Tax=Naumovozyma dairenensis (strain ATCC 10597 / BCRC 20456 / CBS 421 / NBRC 0211 / NRRL Y-12639) TaxID=1071378 RepID=G0WHC8_NAUDC|nr:hypothetical protein NDAI_0J00160 [Naumovozyma dairenensis CBS 421]CCD26908.1 hypothetical protein NDAI_0J00160 [Naumovozyma dairenensis CBS 421]